jgi:vacuolar-type H+-ATPase subunit H
MAEAMPTSTSLDVVKRVRTAEGEWEERLATAKATQVARLASLTSNAEAAVAAARAQADQERARTVETARTEADREAAQILAQGRTEAQAAAAPAKGGVNSRRADILAAILGDLASD